jgi:hypothetical protein
MDPHIGCKRAAPRRIRCRGIAPSAHPSFDVIHVRRDAMKALAEFSFAALTVAALGAAAVHAIHAQVISPAVILQQSAATAAPDTKVYADWQGAFTQPFGARVLSQGAPGDAIAGQAPSHGLNLPIFGGLEKMQVWHEVPQDKGL